VPTNPNGANQYILDPRQKLCWNYYTDPKSETFGNATQSAIKAGYEECYADQITTTDWFIGKLWRLNATLTGEKKLKEILELPMVDQEGKVDVGLARIQADLAKYITSTLGKREGYSTQQNVDHTTGGKPIPILGNVHEDTNTKEDSTPEEEN
jgi:hypothetical protein